MVNGKNRKFTEYFMSIVMIWLLVGVSFLSIFSPIAGGNNEEMNSETHDMDEMNTPQQKSQYRGTRSLADSPWPMFRGNVRHTGLSHYDTSGNTGKLKWKFYTGSFTTYGNIASSPIIDTDGTIYISSEDGIVYAINSNCTEKWNFTIVGRICSTAAIDFDGTIYIGSMDQNLYAIYPNGTEKWRYKTNTDILSSPVIGSDGTIYISSDKLYAINPNGTKKWSFYTGNTVSSPAISPNGTIYVGSDDHNLYAINPNGTKKWSFLTGEDIKYSSPAIDSNGTIYVGSEDNKLYAINSDGTEKWSFQTGCWVTSSPAIGSDGTIYVGSDDNKLYAIKPNGTEKWNFTTFGDVWSSPAIGSDGTIYVGSEDSKLYALNLNGTEKWNYNTGKHIRSSPAINIDDTIYIWSYDFNLYAIGPNIPNQPPSANVGPDQNVYVNQTVYFDGSGSYDSDNDTLIYKWDFGDGTGTSWQNSSKTSYSYPKTGKYNVILKVTDGSLWDTDTCIVRVLIGPQLADSPWPMFMNNPRYTGLSNYDTTKNSGELKWKFETGGRITASPVIGSDGTIYFGSADKYIYALNSNGTEKWRFLTDGMVGSAAIVCSDGSIYIESGAGALLALDPNGMEKWRFWKEGRSRSSSVVIDNDGILYICTSSDLLALFPNGTLKWRYETTESTFNLPPTISSDGTILFGTSDYCHAVNPDGTMKWRYNQGNAQISFSPGIGSDGTIYIATGGDDLIALNNTGSEIWRKTVDTHQDSSIAIGSDGTLYFGSDEFRAIYPNGTQKWEIEFPGYITTSPAICSKGIIYVGSDNNFLYAIFPNGTEKWRFQTEKSIYSSPAIGSDGTIYFGSNDGYLYAIDGNKSLQNQHPIANAGPDQNVTVNQTVYFNGSASYDPDGGPITYKWSFGDGTSTDWLNDSTTSHSYNKVGIYTVTLTVRDVTHPPLLTSTDTCIVRVFDFKENHPPVANAGPDQNITVGELINFDGSESYDPDGIIISYDWTSSIDGKLGLGKIIQNIRLREGIHTVTLLVSDGELTDTDTCIVRVSNISGNLPPVARIKPLKNVRVGETILLSGGDSYDEDGYITQYYWDFGDGTESGWINLSTIEHNWDNTGTYTITLTVMDDDGATSSVSYDINVTKLDGDGNGDGNDNDTDADGLPNAWELEFGLDPFDPSDANLDTDGDSLTNHEEYILGTDPTKFDTDGDGVIDSSDAFPLDKAASVDSDGDGYPDAWNPGMSEKDSTTGLKLDAYPHDPNRYKKETSQDNIFAIILVVIVIIILLLIATTKLFLSRSKQHREKIPYSEDEILDKVKDKILLGEPLKELEYSRNEISDMVERTFKNGQISESTYNLIRSEILYLDEAEFAQPKNSFSNGKE